MAEIGVIGAGSWGTALAVVLAHNGHNVTVWSILEDEVEMLTKEHEHKDKLPGVKIPETISFTTDLKQLQQEKKWSYLQYRHHLREVQHIIWQSLSQRDS